MKFHGNLDVQKNKLQQAAFETVADFPPVPVVGQVCFKGTDLYCCVSIEGTPAWVKLSENIRAAVAAFSATSTWTLNHTFGIDVVVQCYDNTGRMILPDYIDSNTLNMVQVSFSVPQTGRMVVLAGGSSESINRIQGDLLPIVTQVQNIGSPSLRWGKIYVDEAHLSVNTLYLGDTPILGTDAGKINIAADTGQSIDISTLGTGISYLRSEAGTIISTSGMNADVVVQATGAGSKVRFGATTSIDLVAPTLNLTGALAIGSGQTIGGDLTVSGSLYVNGTTTTVNSSTVSTVDNVVELNRGQTGTGVTAGTAGLRIDRGDGADFLIIFDEVTDSFQTGFIGATKVMATKEYVDSITIPLNHIGSGGSAHADATTSVAGFLSAADKVRLDALYTNLSSGATIDGGTF